jgi:hypothetical protein
MKIATNNSGVMIEACADAPKKALCPHCKGIVTLRWRRRSTQPGDVVYFWRHEDHANQRCPARFRYYLIDRPYLKEYISCG